MVQAIENRADVAGRVTGVQAGAPNTIDVSVEVEAVTAVPGFRNLIGERHGGQLTLRIPTHVSGSDALREGQRLRFRVEKRGPDTVIGLGVEPIGG